MTLVERPRWLEQYERKSVDAMLRRQLTPQERITLKGVTSKTSAKLSETTTSTAGPPRSALSGASTLEAISGGCRWPLWGDNPAEAKDKFCGKKRIHPTKAYCEHHDRLAHVETAPTPVDHYASFK